MNSADAASIGLKAPVVSSAPVKIVPRVCSVCGCPDRVTVVEGEYDALGNKRVEHLVTIELRYLRSRQECTTHLEVKGWRHRMHQARNAMERFICRPCLIGTQEIAKEFRRKRDRELGAQNHDPYYLAVCGE